MRTRTTLVAVLALSSLMVACGDDDGTPSTTPDSASPGTVPTTAQLDAKLLTLDDVGSSWRVGSPINDADLTDSVQVSCDAALDAAVIERLRADTGVQFEPADDSYGLLIEFLTAGEPTQLAADLQAFIEAETACPPASTTPDGSGYTDLQPLALPELGDQQYAKQQSTPEAPESEVRWFGRSAIVRVGSVMVSVGLIEVIPIGDEPAISDEEFVAIVTAAVARVTG